MTRWIILLTLLTGLETARSDELSSNPFSRETAPTLPIRLTTPYPEACTACEFDRAGNPQWLRPHAHYSNGKHDRGGWVAGGGGKHAGPPAPHEGTWGWDYLGLLNIKRVFPGWHHSDREQGSVGAYKTDGPRVRE